MKNTDNETALPEEVNMGLVNTSIGGQISPANAFVDGTWEHRLLVDVLARMSKVFLESRRSPCETVIEVGVTVSDTGDAESIGGFSRGA